MDRVARSPHRKPDTLDLFPSSVQEPKIEGLDLYTYEYIYICISVSGFSWNFQPDKSPQNRTVRFRTGHLATLSMDWSCSVTRRTFAWNYWRQNERQTNEGEEESKLHMIWQMMVALLHSNGQLRTERDGDTEKGCQKPRSKAEDCWWWQAAIQTATISLMSPGPW